MTNIPINSVGRLTIPRLESDTNLPVNPKILA